MRTDSAIEDWKNNIKDIGGPVVGCLATLVSMPIWLPAMPFILYFCLREPPVRTKPVIPRLTTRGKIRFLEKQLKNVDEASYHRRSWYSGWTDPHGMTFSMGTTAPSYEDKGDRDLYKKKEEIMTKLVPLYEQAGMHDKARELKEI